MKHILFFFFLFTVAATAQTASTEAPVPETVEKLYRTTEVDLKPQLKDGMYTLSMFISENFKFQDAVKNKRITIFSSFIIEPDGTMTDVKAFHISVKDYIPSEVVQISTKDQKIHESDQIETMKGETVRVLKLFNTNWIPATKDGKRVRCLYNYPINFNIE